MIAIVCLDNNNGMMFNHRRQSRDRVVIQDILHICQDKKLWMDLYSQQLFAQSEDGIFSENNVIIRNIKATGMECDFMEQAKQGEYCFVENRDVTLYENRMEKIIIYQWNRTYPADFFFNIDLKNWRLLSSSEFSGYSHEKITKNVYGRK